MGRRRRRAAHPRKGSLLFEESPVEGERRSLSPLQCADNPVTAVSVPVDPHSTVPWISPQFGGIPAFCRKRRQTRKRGKDSSNVQGDRTLREKSCSKFPALQFVGEGVRPAKESALKVVRPRGRGLVRDGPTSQDNGLNGNVRGYEQEEDDVCAEIVRRRVSLRKSVNHRPSLARCSEVWGRASYYSPADSSPERPLPVVRSKSPTESTHLCSVLHSQTKRSHRKDGNVSATSAEKKRRNRRKGYDSDILLSPLETSSLSQSERNTPVTVQIPLRVALFASPSEGAFNTSANACPPHSQNDSVSPYTRKSPRISNTAEEGKRPCRRPTAQSLEKPRRSKRLQDKLREAMKYLQPHTPDAKGSTNVLVSDTPELEYSLSYRQRQRLKRKNKLSIG
ncbi:hypothetical protein ACOMHN_029029 [Nucella lapillus]